MAVHQKIVRIAVAVVVVDQGLKVFARQMLSPCDVSATATCDQLSGGPMRLVSTVNAGSVLGFAQGLDIWTLVTVLSLLVLPLYGRWLDWSRPISSLAIGLQAGGALSNLADRVMLGGVVDYLIIPGVPVVLNLADVALVVGALLAGWSLHVHSQTRENWSNDRSATACSNRLQRDTSESCRPGSPRHDRDYAT